MALTLSVAGGDFKDVLSGLDGDDALWGNGGKDKLKGGDGDDTLRGGLGNDRLKGGADGDFFVFSTKFNEKKNVDKIADFSHKHDTILLDNTIFKKLKVEGDLMGKILRDRPASWRQERLCLLRRRDRRPVLRSRRLQRIRPRRSSSPSSTITSSSRPTTFWLSDTLQRTFPLWRR